jgi:hypothetical protein
LSIESLVSKLGTDLRGAKVAATVLVCVLVLAGTACGGEESMGGGQGSAGEGSEQSSAAPETGGASEETTAAEEADPEEAELARAEVGNKEISSMMPAGGEKPDRARPLPENPPEGIEVYPATTNKTVSGPIEYDRTPPTNGNHDPLWQNCGFYEEPIKDRHAVHSMDHGVVWITYRPDLPSGQVNELRSYGEEDYVIVSPYPGQDAPVISTSWRVQLELDGAGDPRLREFVDGFRVSEIAPLSGNRCEGGVGNPRA